MATMAFQQKNMIGNGNGYSQIGSATTDLQELGSLEGNVVETVTREELVIEDGEPKLTIDKRVIRETAALSCTLKEKRLRDVCTQLGLPSTDVTTLTSSDIAVTNEQKKLYDTSWAHLYGWPVKTSPAHTVTDGGATPVTYVETTDYVLDKTNGLIRRVSTGSISHGATVYINYTYTRPAGRKLVFGGRNSTLIDRYLRFVYIHPDNTYADITEYPKASPGPSTVQNYNSGAMNTRELTFTAIADFTQDEGARLRMQYQLGSTIVS